MADVQSGAARTEPDGPGRDEAEARLDALEPGARYAVRQAAQSRMDPLKDPVLAAAVVAVARRELYRFRYVGIGFGVVGAVAIVAVTLFALEHLVITLVIAGAMLFAMSLQYLGYRHAYTGAIEKHVQTLREHGSIPPPGPSSDFDTARRGTRRLRKAAAGLGAATVALLAATGWVSYQDTRLEDHLREVGEVTEAEVMDVDRGRRLIGLLLGDRLEVRFSAGAVVTTRLVASDVEDIDEGDTIEVLYDPGEPSVARLAEDPSGRNDHFLIGTIMLGSMWLVAGIVLWRNYRR